MAEPSKKFAAYKAMAGIGFPEDTVKPVLNRLLDACDGKWQHIEAESFRLLADTILDCQEEERDAGNKKRDNDVGNWRKEAAAARDKPQHSGDGHRTRQEEECPSSSRPTFEPYAEKRQVVKKIVSTKSHLRQRGVELDFHSKDPRGRRTEAPSPQTSPQKKRVEVASLQPSGRSRQPASVSSQGSHGEARALTLARSTGIAQENTEPGSFVICRRDRHPVINERNGNLNCRKKPKMGPGVDIFPEYGNGNSHASLVCSVHDPSGGVSPEYEIPLAMIHPSEPIPARNEGHQERAMQADSFTGDSSAQRKHNSKTLAMEHPHKRKGKEVIQDAGHRNTTVVSVPEASSPNFDAAFSASGRGQKGSNGPCQGQKVDRNNENGRPRSRTAEHSNINSNSLALVQQPQLGLGDARPLLYVTDVTKGEERFRISLVNKGTSEQDPPSFRYIPQNIVYQNAYINLSLARIGDENCCLDCVGDCLAASIPCACARETGGEFAYTRDGLLREKFLDACIEMKNRPQKNRLYYCKDCPLERSKNEVKPNPCEGHLLRKFIKECWSKCGCNKQCGNRVVQRGITCELQVFFTSKGKGWGLRTLEDLPKGTFVCEYVGEILTNMELYDRTIHTTGNAKHTYPVLLDADWGTERVLKDEEALCLDATFYGNVARFINHRCYDANLIDIPVEVETPDHHYYHLAFFTTKKVEAFEELTWDYGIDFYERNHPIKAFRCRCKSEHCRDPNRKTSTPHLVNP